MKPYLAKAAAAVAVIASVEWLCGWGRLFAWIEGVAKANDDSLAVFFVLMSVGCAFAFPLSLCYLFAGAAFGFWAGWGVCVAVLLVSSAIGYALGRFFMPEGVLRRMALRVGVSPDPSGSGMFNINFFVRVVPGIPYWIQNVVLGGMRPNFALYMGVNVAAQGAIAGAMNFLGASVSGGGPAKYAAFAVLIAVLAAFHACVNAFYKMRGK